VNRDQKASNPLYILYEAFLKKEEKKERKEKKKEYQLFELLNTKVK